MSPVSCPNCDTPLPPQELADGWGETCGKRIPPHVLKLAKVGGPPEPPPARAEPFRAVSAVSAPEKERAEPPTPAPKMSKAERELRQLIEES